MVNAIVLIKAEPSKINTLAQHIVNLANISEVYSVGGQVDLVAIIRAKDNEGLSDTVTNHIVTLDGILSTETLIAFRTFSQHDLERMFSIGWKE